MKRLVVIFGLIFGIALGIEPGQIAINEICFNPAGVDEEWIELRNNTDTELILDSAVTISDGEGTYTFEGIMIPAGDFLTLMSRTEGGFPFEADLDISAAELQLANGQDQVVLRYHDTVIDSVHYYSSWAEDDHTLERINPFFSGIHPDNWSSGTFMDGTPDRENTVFNTDTNFPPAILHLLHDPLMPTSSDPVTISAHILDETDLLAVRLSYTAGAETTTVDMTEESAMDFSAILPTNGHGTMVSYSVIAWDAIEQSDTSGWQSYFVIDSTVEGFVVINEIMYDSPGADTEWVELYNRSEMEIDLTGWTIKDGSSSFFTFIEGSTIPANGYVVVAKSIEEFTSRYGLTEYVYGDAPYSLNNSGDSLTLRDGDGRLIDMLEYSTSVGWPIEPHGDGYTLSLIDPELDNRLPESWLASDEMWGTPLMENFPGAVSEKANKPEIAAISSISPNPFNGAVSIELAENAEASIYDIKGNLVHTLEGGRNIWRPTEDMPTGVYLVKAQHNEQTMTKRAIYLK